jgi:hypothetical protein
LLGYLGLLPFLALVGANFLYEIAIFSQAFLFYSISIMSFVAGSLWRTTNSDKTNWLIVLPTIPTLLLALLDIKLALLYLGICYVFILLLQKRSAEWQSLSFDYQRMRERVSSVVLVCHLFFAAQLHHTI